ncbi:hypothetical protein Cni_G14185 [Canna indica]|uniref:Uncharacterized protein n=1 Tax=Canna indica TaxID=4628 RepID=A0AAQ3KHA0_9LILI|nr:hypothetical protein Cni_G14185 [Canna indica]
MKCKSHPYEQGAGVCASCLRERLFALIAAQNELSSNNHHRHRRSDPAPPPPPPLVFPRSVSPYVSRRRSAGSDASPARPHYLRFFSTPQLGPTFGAAARGGGFGEIDGGRRRRFSALRSLFRHPRSEETEPGVGKLNSSPSSGSWFSALIRGARKKNKKSQPSAAAAEEAAQPRRTTRSRRAVERGMTPSLEGDEDDRETSEDEWGRPTSTPMRQFPGNHRHHRSLGAVSGLSVCLSPLARLRSEARRSKAADAWVSGDLRSPESSIQHRNAAAGGAALGPNRSRKLADMGRFK